MLARLLGVYVITIKRELKTLGFHWEGAAKAGHWVKEGQGTGTCFSLTDECVIGRYSGGAFVFIEHEFFE